MTRPALELMALCVDARDPAALARFWGGVLDREVVDGTELVPPDDPGFGVRFLASEESKLGPNQMHFDLRSETPQEQDRTVARALELGGRHLDIGQGPEEGHVVLADPEGNEFCVIPAGNNFLADCAFIGALSSDGTQAVGYFWAAALGWPLVWDQDEETAIQAPGGGSKISWGGPPVNPKLGKNRLHLDLAPPAGGDQQVEVDRLLGLGATLTDPTHDVAGAVALFDPDGNEFCVLRTQ